MLLSATLLGSSATAQDLTKDQDRLRIQLREQVSKDAALTPAEAAALDPDLATYARQAGTPQAMRETVEAAVRSGCKGTCLAEAIRAMNAVMARGESCTQARDLVQAQLEEQARTRTAAGDAERGAQLRERVAAQLQQRTQAREREQLQQQERAQERARARSGGMQGGAGSGRR